MKKMISILTLCLVTGFSMISPVAASTAQPSTETSDNVNIVQSELSDTYLCLNQNALFLNGVYLNGSCMKLQPKCNFSVVNSSILQQISGYNAFCQKFVQQNSKASTDSTLAAKSTLGTQMTTSKSVATETKAATNTQQTTCPNASTQAVAGTDDATQSTEYSKSKTQTTTCPRTTTGTKETQNTEETKSTQTTSAANPTNSSNSNTSTTSFREFQKKVIELVNSERAKVGLNALSENNDLNNVATLKSEDMVKLNYFSHTSPTYGSPFEMLSQFNISYTAAGENIAYGQSTPEEVMNGWMNSSGHKANILNTNFTQIGVGVAQKANGQYVWTQEFSRP